jgi:alkylated DNA repair dioxygenase AlkB
MLSLFPDETIYPAGFSYQDNFITPNEEQELLQAIEAISLNPMQFQGYEAKRKVASYGWDWNFERRELKRGKEFPMPFRWLVKKVADQLQLPVSEIGELLVTEYPVDSVINWHRDAPPFDLIAGISLKADCLFKLRPYDKAKQGRKSIISVPVKRNSLYLMRDEARNEWEHSIAPVKTVRYSITLRTLRKN